MTARQPLPAGQAALLAALKADLAATADPAHRDGARNFFKEAVRPLGVRSRDLNVCVARHWPRARALGPAGLLELCEELWASGVFEHASVACKWSARALPDLDMGVFATFERWLATRVDNWAHCDDLASHCIGGLLARHPQLVERTLPWLDSPNRWLRRGAAVAFVYPARSGQYAHHVFRVADMLLEDPDDLVRKGYGWLLKEASRVWPREVLEFVLARRDRMPRVALRYAIELMPPDWRKRAMSRQN